MELESQLRVVLRDLISKGVGLVGSPSILGLQNPQLLLSQPGAWFGWDHLLPVEEHLAATEQRDVDVVMQLGSLRWLFSFLRLDSGSHIRRKVLARPPQVPHAVPQQDDAWEKEHGEKQATEANLAPDEV